MDVGVVGIGTMGILVASTLREAGHHVVVADVNAQALKQAQEFGAVPAECPQEVAEQTQLRLRLSSPATRVCSPELKRGRPSST